MSISIVTSIASQNNSWNGFNETNTSSAINTTGANCLVWLRKGSSGGFSPSSSISDNKGNTWILAKRQPGSPGSYTGAEIYYCINPTVGTGHTFTQTRNFQTYESFVIIALSGVYSLDTVSGSSWSSDWNYSSAQIAPSQANDFVVLVGPQSNPTIGSPGNPFTNLYSLGGNALNISIGVNYQIQTTQTTFYLWYQGPQYESWASATFKVIPVTTPTVTTQAVSARTNTTATGNGNVTADGGGTITERGTVISTSANPTTSDHKDTASGTTGAFTTSITALSPNTTYHVRAYAINSAGTSYGSDVSFKTLYDPLIAGTGVFTLTGIAMLKTYARKLTTSVTAFTLTGVSMTTLKTMKAILDSTSFILTGFGLTIRRHVGYLVQLASGSFTLTGNDINITKVMHMITESASFVLTGININANKGYHAIIEVGSFVLTGINSSFNKGYHIILESGSFLLTGINIITKRAYNIVLDTGVFMLTGINAIISKGYHVILNTGTFTLTGIDILVKKWRGFYAACANFVLTGNNINIRGQGSWKWVNAIKHSMSVENESKHTINFINEDKS